MARTYAGFLFVGTKDGGPPAIKRFPLAAAIYTEGNVLRLSSTTGSATKAAAAGTSILGVLGCNLTAAQAASATTGPHPVYLADGNNLFKAKMLASSTPQAKVGDLCDIAAIATTYNYRLSATAASTSVISIWGFDKDEALSAHTGVNYYVSFARSVFAQSKSDVTT